MNKKATAGLTDGDKIPDLSLPSSDTEHFSLKQLQGQTIVLYFYPKDDTPGCTTEACDFRDAYKEIKQLGATIIGVSPDPIKKHTKFIGKHQLPFMLLSDENHALCKQFGVWVEKSMYGKTYMGVERSTFIIDKKGQIVKTFRKVKVKQHIHEVIEYLQGANL